LGKDLSGAQPHYGRARRAIPLRTARVVPKAVLKDLFSGGKARKEASAAKKELFELLEGSERGVKNSEIRPEVEAIVDRLKDIQGDAPTTGPDMSAVWELMWTTEKETLFLLEKGIFAVGPAQESYQVIDVETGLLQNVILFGEESEKMLLINSTLQPTSDVRVDFKFEQAELRLTKRTIRLPPFGKGWFDTVYLDNNLRVARDIRGDTLIVKRTDLPLDTFQ